MGSPLGGTGPPGSPGSKMHWVPLDLRRGPTFAQECDEVIRTYIQAAVDGAQGVLDYLRNAIEGRIDTLEEFCRNNDTDPRHVVFDKQLRKLRRTLHADPAQLKQEAESGGQSSSLRKPGEEQPPPPPPPPADDEDQTDSDDDVENVVDDEMADGLFRRASKQALEEIPDAAKAKARSGLAGPVAPLGSRSPRRRQSTIYSWERSGPSSEEAEKADIEAHKEGVDDDQPFPPGFTFKVVLTNQEFHHLMARRRVQLAERRHKHIHKKIQKSNKDGKGVVDLKHKTNSYLFSTGPYVDPQEIQKSLYRQKNSSRWISQDGFKQVTSNNIFRGNHVN